MQEVNKTHVLNNIIFTKTILMFLVVLYHCIYFWNGNWFSVETTIIPAKYLLIIATWLNSFHIYGFTLVSGYLFYHLRYEKVHYQHFVPFLKNKVKRLIVPYLFVAVIWVAPISRYFFEYSWVDLVDKYVLGTSPSQLWFLLMLFNVYILFYLLSDFINQHLFLGIVVILSLYALGLVWAILLPNWYQIGTALRYMPFFWIGFQIRKHNDFILNAPPAVLIISDIFLFVVTYYLDTQESLGVSFVLHIVGAVMAFVILQQIASRINWNNGKFKFLARHTMIIYLFHQQVIYFCIILLKDIVHPYVHPVLNFAIAILVSAAIAIILMKFKYTRFLVGEK